ncbi:MAG: hypothetical protein KUA37_13475 [Desulfomicrobium sp.]|nr:hypothetical protein [Pseudomonadota bacterium]MBV1712995.1 hypothetical protein [Desulfomicrobium sp.]MBU4571965.1 hypothetical protein [Pseudomonadota bacterium]MBU4596114.1 hypothetical protein [Pseudomonadota bacterium]MBV1721418.1 hypothetical protein [Desulfomicrobium sp.]
MMKESGVCHVLGSGYSLNDSLSLIDSEKDFVIGFNFSGLAYRNSDLYFIEICNNYNVVSKAQYILWRHLCSSGKKTQYIFKNIAERHNCIFNIDKKYGNKVLYLKDAIVGLDDVKSLNFFSKMLLCNSVLFSNQVQSISTAITAVALAYKIGFKKIILHGIDFSGPHFYDIVKFSDVQCELIRRIICSTKVFNYTKMHQTNLGLVTHEELLIYLKEKLLSRGVVLEAALSDSNLGIIFSQSCKRDSDSK